MTRETVIADTPAARATSSIVTAPRPLRPGFAIGYLCAVSYGSISSNATEPALTVAPAQLR
jgi:hypothetical protein